MGTEHGKFLTVLNQRRANNILIEIKRFPAARHIKTAILGMDYSYFNKEIVEVSLASHYKQRSVSCLSVPLKLEQQLSSHYTIDVSQLPQCF